MSQVTHTSISQSSSALSTVTPPVFAANTEDERVRRWGRVFATFSQELDAVQAAMADADQAGGDLGEQLQAASRRYSLLLEAMGTSSGRAKRPCTIYDCCDGISVLLLQQGAGGEEDEVLDAFADESSSLDERVFTGALSQAILIYFERNVRSPEGMVTVSVGSGEFIFMRAAQRDAILQKLHISTTADVY